MKTTSLKQGQTLVSTHLSYRADIDGLRAIAVLAVVSFHAFPASVPSGFVGVDIFFVISGFLISSIVLQELEQGTFSFADFYSRRIRRIFPALLLVMAACGAFGWFALLPDEYAALGKHILGGGSFVSNFLLWDEVGYFDTAAETKPLLHLWSLGIEEQFYIVWPILLLLAWKGRVNVLRYAAAIALISFLINVIGIERAPIATFYSPASRAWELLLGALLAYVNLRKSRYHLVTGALSTDLLRNILAFSGMGLIILACTLITKERSFPGWWALLPTCGATLIIAAGPQAWINRNILSNRVLVWFGLISYPLYLWHWPILSFAHITESGLPALEFRIVAVLAAIALAWLTYVLLERPLRGHSYAMGKIVSLPALMVLVAASGALVHWNGGLPHRSSIIESTQLQKSLAIVEDVANAAACKKRYGFASVYEYCLLANPQKAATVALIGDSHAYHMVAGLTKYYSSQGDNLLLLGTRIPFWGIVDDKDEYQKATKKMLDLALEIPSVKTVIISTALKIDNKTAKGQEYIDAFRNTLQRFVEAGRHVIFVNDVPYLNFEPRACIKRAAIASSQTKVDCSMSRSDYEKSAASHIATVQAVLSQFPTVQLFSTAPYLCDEERCHAMIGGKLIYRDTHHLSYDGDLYIGERFAQEQAELKKALP